LYQLVDKNSSPVTSLTGVDTAKLASYLENGYTQTQLTEVLDVCKA
jgi:hypothetical protein